MNPKNLKEQFRKETNRLPFIKFDGDQIHNPSYVEWLEKKYLEDCLVWHSPEVKPLIDKDVLIEMSYSFCVGGYDDEKWYDRHLDEINPDKIKRWAYLP